jgi:FkbM family methyltransferase
MSRLTGRSLGMVRSLAIYYGIPWRGRRLARFYAQFVAPDSLCFDIGAHAGNRIRCWRRLGASVVAVEPQRDFFRLLKLLYGRDRNVTLINAAVGRCEGRATLHVSERTPTLSTLSAEWTDALTRSAGFKGVRWSSQDATDVTTLQRLIERYGLPRFVKLDIEGYEAEALAGLSQPVPSLSFEYLPAVRQVALSCIDRLSQLGDYRYNWSQGETHRLGEPRWLDADGIRAFIVRLPDDAGSGDVYARLSEG